MKVLLSNDDGIDAPGLRSIYRALSAAGHEVFTAAPSGERSGAGCSISSHNPLQVREVREKDFVGFAVSGTPADCVLLGMGGLFGRDFCPDIVVSGINRGPNAGLDVLYSGTVGAAIQGALMGVPGLAVSSHRHLSDNMPEAEKTVRIMADLNWEVLPANVVYNLNFPAAAEARGLKVCPVSTEWTGFGNYERRVNPNGQPYWWIGNLHDHFTADHPGLDRGWLSQGYITLTPLRYTLTDQDTMQLLRHLESGA